MSFAAAHRGLSGEFAENTMPAFRAAVEAGFPCLEMDLRLTHDKQVVVLHDAGIDRTTDGNGRVKDFTYAELQAYDTGAGPIPRLTDVMHELRDWNGLWNLEVKAMHGTEAVIDLVEHHGLEDRSLVSSMNPRSLRRAMERHPDVPRGLIVLGPPDSEDLRVARESGCTWINADVAYLDERLVEEITDQGFKLGAWTVNVVEDALDLVAHGAHCIITDMREVHAALPPVDARF